MINFEVSIDNPNRVFIFIFKDGEMIGEVGTNEKDLSNVLTNLKNKYNG